MNTAIAQKGSSAKPFPAWVVQWIAKSTHEEVGLRQAERSVQEVKDGEVFSVEFELSFPPDQKTGASTTVLRTVVPISYPVAERVAKFLAFHAITPKTKKLEPQHADPI